MIKEVSFDNILPTQLFKRHNIIYKYIYIFYHIMIKQLFVFRIILTVNTRHCVIGIIHSYI